MKKKKVYQHKKIWSRRVAYELQDILGEKLDHPELSIASKAILATFKVMGDALKRGERVYIEGFGTFTVKKVKAHIKECNYMYKFIPDKKTTPSMVKRTTIAVPERRYAHFSPSQSLKDYINEGYQDEP